MQLLTRIWHSYVQTSLMFLPLNWRLFHVNVLNTASPSSVIRQSTVLCVVYGQNSTTWTLSLIWLQRDDVAKSHSCVHQSPYWAVAHLVTNALTFLYSQYVQQDRPSKDTELKRLEKKKKQKRETELKRQENTVKFPLTFLEILLFSFFSGAKRGQFPGKVLLIFLGNLPKHGDSLPPALGRSLSLSLPFA